MDEDYIMDDVNFDPDLGIDIDINDERVEGFAEFEAMLEAVLQLSALSLTGIGTEPTVPYWMEDDYEWPHGHFSLDGQGQTVDIVTVGAVEFLTITTAGGNHFFLVIDRTAEENNVHFLSTVSELSLLALADRSGELDMIEGGLEAAQMLGVGTSTQAQALTVQPSVPQQETQGGGAPNPWIAPLMFIVVMGVLGTLQFFKIKKKKKKKAELKAAAENKTEDDNGFGY